MEGADMRSARNIGKADPFWSDVVDNCRGLGLEAVNFPVFPDIPDGLSTLGGKLGKVGNVAPGKRQNRKLGGHNGRAARGRRIRK
jgi:hypothetical protein